jgi:hypothetical protein
VLVEDEKPKMVSAGESIVGTLVVRGIIKPEDAELAIAIVEEELGVWLAIKKIQRGKLVGTGTPHIPR